jgi:arylsulfatase A-like enzyme
MPGPFKGTINLDIRESKPDWNAFLDPSAPKDAPNVLVILYDDTGQAAWSPYGGRITMPTMDRLAKNGLTYTQWHTTSVCSPTRSCFLTGRNHHQNGFGTIAESAAGFPGYAGHIPPEHATIATILRNAGWTTLWIGKNHNVPVDAFDIGANRKHWPLGLGYDRFYGFIGGETNQWYPELIEDNHFVEPPYSPEAGYHFSRDIADKAIGFIRDTKQARPEKPWYLWYCPGANHAPHHAPQEYIDKYKGKFDDGYEAYREWVLARMIERGIMPKDTQLTPINPMSKGTCIEADSVRPWSTLSADEKRLFSRMAEVYAGFSEYTDVQIGRVIDYLEESGQLDNTLIFYCADNGASGEGSPDGSVNENRFFNGYPDDIESNLAMLDKLGSPDTYNHYPTGWPWPSARRTACSSATRSTPAAPRIRWSSTGRKGSGRAASSVINTTTAPTSSRRSWGVAD